MSTYVKRNGKYYNVNRKVEFETEFRETNQGMRVKCRKLGKKMRNARCVTVLTGAGISTSAGIRDLRTGLSTMVRCGPGTNAPLLAKKLLKRRAIQHKERVYGKHMALAADMQMQKYYKIDASHAQPTLTHMSLVSLFVRDLVRYVVTTNIDGLHRKSGFPNAHVVELQGDPYIERCTTCGHIFVRDFHVVENLGSKFKRRKGSHLTGRKCRMEDCDKGLLEDLLVNEGEVISPEVFSDASSMVLESDLVICIGSSLREQPLRVLLKKAYEAHGTEIVIINLMRTPLDYMADLRIFGDSDEAISLLLQEQSPPMNQPVFQITRNIRIGNTYVKPETGIFSAPGLNVPLHAHADIYCEVMDQDGVIISCIQQMEVDLPQVYAVYGATHCIVGVGERDLRQEKNSGTVAYRLEPALYDGNVGIKLMLRPRFGEPPIFFSHHILLNETGSFRTYKVIYDVYSGLWSKPQLVEASHSRFSLSRMSTAGGKSDSLPSLHSTTSGDDRVSSSGSYLTSQGGISHVPVTPIKTPPLSGGMYGEFGKLPLSSDSLIPPMSSGSLNLNNEQWPPVRPYSGQQNLQSRSGVSSGGSSFVTVRPLTGTIRPMTGVSIPMSREEMDAINRPLTGTEDNNTEPTIPYSPIVKNKADNKARAISPPPRINETKKVIKKRVRTPNPALKFHELGQYKKS